MTTFAPDLSLARRMLEAKKQQAWAAYRESTQDLGGQEYEEAEERSWNRLQRRLEALDRELAEPAAPGATPHD